MKKIISLFLAIMVICSLISINAFASSDVPMTIIGELNEYNSQTVYSNEELNQIADEISEFTDNFNDIRCIKVSKEHKCIVIYISDSFESEKLKELAQLFEKNIQMRLLYSQEVILMTNLQFPKKFVTVTTHIQKERRASAIMVCCFLLFVLL